MNTNCKNCDRADCPTFTMPEESEWQNTREDAAAIEAAVADCDANAVDWRARALTEAARADAAEAKNALVKFIATTQANALITQRTEGNEARYIYLEGFGDAGKEILEALDGEP